MKILSFVNEMRKRAALLLLLILVILFTFFFLTNTVFASNSRVDSVKLVTSITIEKGDTLWSIATEYVTEEYSSINQYVEEIKSSNGLVSETIHAGEHLIIPYYSAIE
jgi:cell division protein YceG involved in septum cleavage